MFQTQIIIQTEKKGLIQITELIQRHVQQYLPEIGFLNLFLQHTSASLIIQENSDPSAALDLCSFADILAPDGQKWHRHTSEGADDTTSHMKSAMMGVSLTIPVNSSRLALGTWQGIYLWEHRSRPANRKIVLTVFP